MEEYPELLKMTDEKLKNFIEMPQNRCSISILKILKVP
jgi:hypothetical protein